MSGRSSELEIEVTSNVPFRLPETFRLSENPEIPNENYILKEAGIINLNLLGFGKGKLRLLRVFDDGGWSTPIRTPLGPIRMIQIRDNDSLEVDPYSYPLSTQIVLEEMPEERAKSFRFTLKAGNEEFEGLRGDDEEDRQLIFGDLGCFRDVKTNNECLVWFPQDPEVKRIKKGVQFLMTF